MTSGTRARRDQQPPGQEARADPPGEHGVFCIEWGTPQGQFTSDLFGFATLAAAGLHVERSAKAVSWKR